MINRLFVFIWKHKSYLLGTLGIFIAWVWNGLWTSGILFRRWQDLYGFMPDHIFFPGEEFIVLNAHDNSWLPSLGFLVLAVVSIILSFRQKKLTFGLLIIIFISFFIVIVSLLPCLCRAREYSYRISCQKNLKSSSLQLIQYIQAYQQFPENFDIKVGRAGKICVILSPEKKTSGERFVIFEDAPRTHAGDLRHRLWSDGVVNSYYPWKTTGGGVK
ncbi:MAG: hypothetical protein V8T90_13615 [Victivallales bacterium]